MVVQLEHKATLDDNEYEPAAQGVHVVAPALVPVSVINPAPHDKHDATFEDNEYSPATHGVHVVAPALIPVFVMDPAPQVAHEATSDGVE